MIPLEPPFRLARREDGPVLAELVNFAGEGTPLAIWTAMAAGGRDPWEIGAERQAARTEKGQTVVVDAGAGVVAGLTGYRIDAPEPVGDGIPAQFRALQELENLAARTWYVNVLAALPDQRRRGWGTALLAVAERIARAEGLDDMSVIVAGRNDGARRLYERSGYVETARRAVASAGDDRVLLVKRGIGPPAT